MNELRSSDFTPKQCAVILIRNWITGGGHDPASMGREEMSDNLWFSNVISEKKHDQILIQVEGIMRPFEDRIEKLYSNIKGVD